MAIDGGDVKATLVLNIKKFLQAIRTATSGVDEMAEDIDESLDDILDDSERTFEGMRGMATIFGTGLTTAGASVGAGLYAITTGFKETETTLRSFEAQTGITGDELKKFKKAIESSYLDGYGESIQEVSDTYSNFQRELKLTASETELLTNKSFQLKDVYQYETQDSLRAVSSLMKNMGITGEKAFDLITSTARNTGDASGDLLDTVAEYTPRFKEAGISSQAMFKMLQSGLQSGARNYDVIGDSVKEFNILLTEGGDNAEEALSKVVGMKDAKTIMKDVANGTYETGEAMVYLIDEIAKMKNKTEQQNVGIALFGTLWEEVGLKGLQAMSDIDQSVDDYTGSLEKAHETLEGQGTSMEQVKREFEQLTNLIGQKLAPYLSKGLELSSKFLSKVLEFATANPILISIITGVGVLVAVLGTVVGAIIAIGAFLTPIVAGFTFLSTVIVNLGLIISAIGATILSLPVIIGVAIVALVALIIWKWDEIKAFSISVWTAIVDFILSVPEILSNAWIAFTTFMLGLWESLKTGSINIWNGLLNFIKSVPELIYNFFTSTLPFIIGFIVGSWVKMQITIGQKAKEFFTVTIPNVIKSFWIFIQNLFNVYIPMLLIKIGLFVVGAVAKFQKFKSDMTQKAKDMFLAVILWISKLPSKITSFSSQLKSSAITLGLDMIKGLQDLKKNLPKTIKDAVLDAIKGVGKLGSQAFSALKNIGASMWSGFKKGLGINSPSYLEKAMFAISDEGENMKNNLFKTFRKVKDMPQINSLSNLTQRQQELSPNNNNSTTQNFNGPLVQISGGDNNSGKKTAYSLYDLITFNKRAMGVEK